MDSKLRNITDGVLITTTIVFSLTYSCLGFFAGTVLSLIVLPWFFLTHSNDQGYRKTIFITTSWITSVIAFIFILSNLSGFLEPKKRDSYYISNNLDNYEVDQEKSKSQEHQNVIKYLILAHVIILFLSIIAQLLRLF